MNPGHLFEGPLEKYVVRDVAVCAPDETAGSVRTRLIGRQYACLDDLPVCDADGRLRGLVPVTSLFAAADDAVLADLMDADPPIVHQGDNEERAAWKAVRHGESSLAVLTADGRFVGLVPPERLLGVLLRDHDQDFARLGGYLASTEQARHAAEEPLGDRLWHRLPWLLLGLFGAALSAWFVGLFEGRLEGEVRLAFFIPGVVYMADAIGTQTEALLIRGLSVGVPLRSVLRLELLTGPVIGVLLGLVSWPAVWLATGSAALGLTVALALWGACAVATLVAVLLPWLMTYRGKDPAFGSGPLATVIQDLLSLVIYFGVAVLVLG